MEFATARCVGANLPRLNPGLLSHFPVHLPNLTEQRRIAKILEKADAVRRKRHEAVALTDIMMHATYLSTVGPAHAGYESWPCATVAQLAAEHKGSIRSGPFGSALLHSEFVQEGVAVLGIDNAVQNRFAWSERRYITADKYAELKRYRVYPGDVIITIMGTTGRSAVVPADVPEAITTKHLATITVDRRKAFPEFLAQAIHRDPGILHQIDVRNRGAIMPGLNLGLIQELELRLPPLPLQQAFDSLCRRIRRMQDHLQRAADQADELFQSLVHRAFRGEL